MAIQKQILSRIKDDFRLNVYEVKIWVSLLSRGIATAAELAEISGVPRSRCYDVLESLEKKGIIIMKVGKPIKYIAVHPEEILERVKKDLKENSENTISTIDELRNTEVFKELDLMYKTGIEHVDASKISALIVGRKNIHNAIKEMALSAEKSILITTTNDGFIRKMNILKSISPNLNKKKINVKIVAPVSEERAKKLHLSNINLTNSDANVRFVSIDHKKSLFMVNDESADPEDDIALSIDSGFFTKAMNELFTKNLK